MGCLNGHLLSRVCTSIAAANMGFHCDWCQRFFARDSGYTINRCHECNYDVCENCLVVHKLLNLISQYLGLTKNWRNFNENVQEIKNKIETNQQLLMSIDMDHTP